MTTNTDSIPVVRAFTIFGTQARTRRNPRPVEARPERDAILAQEERERQWQRNLLLIQTIAMR